MDPDDCERRNALGLRSGIGGVLVIRLFVDRLGGGGGGAFFGLVPAAMSVVDRLVRSAWFRALRTPYGGSSTGLREGIRFRSSSSWSPTLLAMLTVSDGP